MHRRILIVDDHDDLASALAEVFVSQRHEVKVLETRSDAVAMDSLEDFDLVITDLDVRPEERAEKANGVCLPDVPQPASGEHVKAFKFCAANYRRDAFDEEELKVFVATVLDYKIRFVDKADFVKNIRENIQFELPSALSLMHIVLEYLMKRVEKLGVCKPEQTNMFVALDEAFVNAIKHGNKYDPQKLVRVTADVSAAEVWIEIEDEGLRFDDNYI